VDILSNVFVSDGAWFHLSGCLNRIFGCGVVKLHVPIKNCPYIIQKIGVRYPVYRRCTGYRVQLTGTYTGIS
jgi:hypothetical protein